MICKIIQTKILNGPKKQYDICYFPGSNFMTVYITHVLYCSNYHIETYKNISIKIIL